MVGMPCEADGGARRTRDPLRLRSGQAFDCGCASLLRSTILAQDDKLFRADQSFGGAHVFVMIIDADHDYVFGRWGAVFGRFGGYFEIVVLGLGIGKVADGLDVLPIAGIDGIFGALDGGEAVGGAEGDMNLVVLD